MVKSPWISKKETRVSGHLLLSVKTNFFGKKKSKDIY